MNALAYMCCFCGEGIGESADKVNRLDPCAIIVVANWQRSSAEQAEQQFFCHLKCFEGSLAPGASGSVELESLVPSDGDHEIP